jgi:glucose dehydrogenase
MATLRTVVAALMSKGVISAGWYSILTGLVLLYVAYLLSSAGDTDPAAPYIAVLFAVTGVWQLWRGVRLQVQRKSVR